MSFSDMYWTKITAAQYLANNFIKIIINLKYIYMIFFMNRSKLKTTCIVIVIDDLVWKILNFLYSNSNEPIFFPKVNWP